MPRPHTPNPLEVLKEGIEVFNVWRTTGMATGQVDEVVLVGNLTEVDFSGTDLSALHLATVNFSRANLRGSNLSRTDLTGANLSRADLTRANLTGANLTGANLSRAKLSEASLHGADLRRADLTRANLVGAKASGADLRRANFSVALLHEADLSRATLREAHFNESYLRRVDLSEADLRGAFLSGADLTEANLSAAKLGGASLVAAILIQTNLTDADLSGCRVYGISTWDVKLNGAKQCDIVITQRDQPDITVDNLEIAQFLYLLLHNEKIRSVIDTITSKLVLILGRFTPERKAVLDALRGELRKRDYLPVLFDFEKPASRDITETLSLLARMARFVIADITEARSIPQELMVIAPDLPSVPIQPLLQKGFGEYGMFEHFRRYPWVLEEHVYTSSEDLIADLGERIIGPAEVRVRELRSDTGLRR
jgi:uncharacterized protein YjbI with pentapeptide repeats